MKKVLDFVQRFDLLPRYELLLAAASMALPAPPRQPAPAVSLLPLSMPAYRRPVREKRSGRRFFLPAFDIFRLARNEAADSLFRRPHAPM